MNRFFACALMTVCLGGTTLAEDTLELDRVLERFDEVQRRVESLQTEFTMTTESSLLTEAIESRGRVYLTKPGSIRWEFRSPEEMRFVISDNQYVGYFPDRKRAERRDVERWREQLFRFLGLGQDAAELAEFYDISLAPDPRAVSGAIGLALEPKKRRVRKKVESVLFWIDEGTYLPVRVEYDTKSGDRRVIEFEEMEVNPTLSASLYEVELPPDVEVRRGFSGFSSFGVSR